MNRYLKLLADNRQVRSYAPAKPIQANDTDEATIYLYDTIVGDELTAEYCGGVAPESFVKALNEITASVIHLRINSPGGDVFAARAMEQALREHSAKIVAHIDGLAASAASFVAMAADEIQMNEGSFFMIHKAWTFAMGNSDELLSTAGLLEKVDQSQVKTYANRTGQEPELIGQWMAAETWMDAQTAVEFGFADTISQGVKASAKWDLSAYDNAPNIEGKAPAPEPEPSAKELQPQKLSDQDRRLLLARLKIKTSA